MKSFERLANRRTDFTMCNKPFFEKDSEGLHKFVQFDAKVNILHKNETKKHLRCLPFAIVNCEFV